MSVRTFTMRSAAIRLLVLLVACGSKAVPPPPPAPQPPVAKPVLAPGVLHDTSQGDVMRLVGTQVPLKDLPVVAEAVGLPVSGLVDVDIELSVPAKDYSRARGKIAFTCTGCRIGDDVAKLKIFSKNKRTADFAGDGLMFGHLDVDKLDVKIAVDGGRLRLEQWKLESKDLDVQLALGLELAADLGASQVKGCLKFKPTEALLQRDPRTHAVISTTGASLGPDQLFHIVLEGTYGQVKRLARDC